MTDAYPHTVLVVPVSDGWGWSCGCGQHARFATERECRTAGLAHQVQHTRAYEATQPEYPEHEKLAKIKDKSQAIGEFLEWAEEKGWHLAEWVGSPHPFEDRMVPIQPGMIDVLAEYFDIDQDILEAEKRAMLDEIRKANQQSTKSY